MMLESFVLYVARDRVEKYGKNYLSKNEGILEIIGGACKEADKALDKNVRDTKEYLSHLMKKPIFFELVLQLKNLENNLYVKNYDTSLSLEEKRSILKNSIKYFNIFFIDLMENYNYKKFENENKEYMSANTIIESLMYKIDDENELQEILNSMEKINMNFILDYKGEKIYPIVTDLLIDFVATEFEWSIDKALIQKIITSWKEAMEAQSERKFFAFTSYKKMELIEEVKYYKLRKFLLSEYSRTLGLGKKELGDFMRNILYYDNSRHKRALTEELENIDDIPKRPFLLEKTKLIIGGV